jgi:hypothetical protein
MKRRSVFRALEDLFSVFKSEKREEASDGKCTYNVAIKCCAAMNEVLVFVW